MRDFLRQFLLYSRSERRAVITLIVLILLVIISPKAYHFYASKTNASSPDSTLQSDIAQWQKGSSEEADSSSNIVADEASNTHKSSSALFYFDPNTIGVSEWQKLGLSQKQAEGIEKYKSKGGWFRKADDLNRLYSLTDEDKVRLIPYVRITGVPKAGSKGFYTVEINTADSAAFEALWGIGPVLSARIVKYRESLGGFTNVDQVGEVKGVRDSVFIEIKPHLTVNAALVHKLNINDADYETLQKHPYIHAKIAHAIIGYRDNQGKFERLDQLKQFKAVTDQVYGKLAPYLTL
jgi:competence ComEA-like helix-hairpin-helix protein